MIINVSTTVTFLLPDEYQNAMEFGEDNKDWVKHETTKWICYRQEKVYSVTEEGGDIDERND